MSALGTEGFAVGNTHGDVYLLNPSGDDDAVNVIRRGSEAILAIQSTANGTLLLTCVGGVIREVDPADGHVASAIVSASGSSFASFSRGGALLSPPASLAGFSCIIDNDGGQISIPAEAFYRDLELQ